MSQLSRPCNECGTTYFKKVNVSLKNWGKSKYCSRLCADKRTLLDGSKQPSKEQRASGERNSKWKGGKLTFICKTCEISFQVDRDRPDAKTCSQACNKAYRKSPEFRNKLSETQRSLPGYRYTIDWKIIVRTCSKYAQWREKVFARDDYTCQDCKVRGGRLNADHIVPFSKIVKENGIESVEDALWCKELWDVNNGRTLCLSCHLLTPTFGSRALKSLTNRHE